MKRRKCLVVCSLVCTFVSMSFCMDAGSLAHSIVLPSVTTHTRFIVYSVISMSVRLFIGTHSRVCSLVRLAAHSFIFFIHSVIYSFICPSYCPFILSFVQLSLDSPICWLVCSLICSLVGLFIFSLFVCFYLGLFVFLSFIGITLQ